jgi:hypothetical protein
MQFRNLTALTAAERLRKWQFNTKSAQNEQFAADRTGHPVPGKSDRPELAIAANRGYQS